MTLESIDRTPVYLSVDVGTGSARAALFTAEGRKLSYAAHPIKTRNEQDEHYEQCSSDIWAAIKSCVKAALGDLPDESKDSTYVAALGIDATCSLVACTDDGEFAPISVVDDANADVDDDGAVYNVMLWLDHRSTKEAEHINESSDEDIVRVRSHFGGIISPENEPPKMLWLKRNKPGVVEAGLFFDLADWVAFKCSADSSVRSSSAAASKWGWGSNEETNEGIWNKQFWDKLGLSALSDDNFRKIGSKVVKPGCSIGSICPAAAEELGLTTECKVASAMVDADAGALWSAGVDSSLLLDIAPIREQRLGMIAGTSTCFMQLSREPRFVEGIWGPYRDAVIPGFHVTAGGQSVTGKLLEHVIQSHPSYQMLCERVGRDHVYDALANKTEMVVAQGYPDPAEHVHCLDYHAGNRSPRADPTLRGVFVGLSLASDEFDLAVKFRATMQALCYGSRLIADKSREAGHDIRVVMACGGLCKSNLFLQELADCLQVPVVLSAEEDAVLLGGAIAGRSAHMQDDGGPGAEFRLLQTAAEMCSVGRVVQPNASRTDYHDRKYLVYKEMYHDFMKYRRIMSGDMESVNGAT